MSRLEILRDEDLYTFMLQLTQVLKFETFLDSSLARFLLRRALRSPRLIGHVLFWFLKAEMHIPEVRTADTRPMSLPVESVFVHESNACIVDTTVSCL